MPKIYFAGPLFSQAEKSFNQSVTNQIEKIGYQVYLPQRDGIERDKLPYSRWPKAKRRRAMFNLDRDKIMECDIFLFILDGRVPDEGACVELGIAYSQQYFRQPDKLIIGLQTDIRAAFLGAKLNPMLKIPIKHIFSSEKFLINFLKKIKDRF